MHCPHAPLRMPAVCTMYHAMATRGEHCRMSSVQTRSRREQRRSRVSRLCLMWEKRARRKLFYGAGFHSDRLALSPEVAGEGDSRRRARSAAGRRPPCYLGRRGCSAAGRSRVSRSANAHRMCAACDAYVWCCSSSPSQPPRVCLCWCGRVLEGVGTCVAHWSCLRHWP